MFGPSRFFFPVLWPLLTSCGSLLLRIFSQCVRKTSPGTHTFFPSLPAAFTVKRFRVAIGLCFVKQTYPRLRPYMRFLYVRPEICPLGDLSTPKIRLSSDSASRRTPLPLANPSHYRADSGLSPYRTCAHRAHFEKTAFANHANAAFSWSECRDSLHSDSFGNQNQSVAAVKPSASNCPLDSCI